MDFYGQGLSDENALAWAQDLATLAAKEERKCSQIRGPPSLESVRKQEAYAANPEKFKKRSADNRKKDVARKRKIEEVVLSIRDKLDLMDQQSRNQVNAINEKIRKVEANFEAKSEADFEKIAHLSEVLRRLKETQAGGVLCQSSGEVDVADGYFDGCGRANASGAD